MFWAAVLPFQITCVLVVMLWAAAVAFAPKLKITRRGAALLGPMLGVAGFIPLCLGVGLLCDAVRFGEFHYATAAEVDTPRIALWLPPAATDLTVDAFNSGFRARYAVDRAELDAWLDELWENSGRAEERKPDGGLTLREDGFMNDEVRASRIAADFAGTAFVIPADAVRYEGPYAARGAGFLLWYSPSEGRVWQRASYW